MKRTRHTPEQIVTRLREADALPRRSSPCANPVLAAAYSVFQFAEFTAWGATCPPLG